MDQCDWEILDMLRNDSTVSLTEIGEKTGLSRFAVKDRIEKLGQDNIIVGPTIAVDPSLVGFRRTVFFEFKTNPHEPWLAKLLEKNQFCDLVDGTAGEYSLFARFRVADDTHFNQVLKKMDEAMGESHFKKYRVINAIQVFKEFETPLKPSDRKTPRLDKVDLRILEILLNQKEYSSDALPISTVELSRLLKTNGIEISQPAVFNRLARLEKTGVILRHTVNVNYQALGFKAKFVVRIKANPNAYYDVADRFLSPMIEISDIYRTGEEYGLLTFLRVKDIPEYNSFLLRLYDSKDIIDTYTTLVLEERKNSPLSLKKGLED